EPARLREVDVLRLAHRLTTRYAGRTLSWGEVLAGEAGTELFAVDVRRALAELRREGRALYASLAAPDAPVAFPRAGRGRAGPRSARSRRRAAPGAPTLPLGTGE